MCTSLCKSVIDNQNTITLNTKKMHMSKIIIDYVCEIKNNKYEISRGRFKLPIMYVVMAMQKVFHSFIITCQSAHLV